MNKNSVLSGGHNESVLSLDINTFGVLASGGEDCLCVWTSDGRPLTKINSIGEDEVTSVCFSRQKPEKLFFSTGTKVFNYDLRSMQSPLCEFEYNEDEINQIVLHDKGQYMASCDDTGAVKIIDLQQNKLFKTLNRTHTNICSSVQFRPQRPWDLVTGGMDFKVVSWDFSSGRVTHEVNVQETGTEEDKYFINPPFVHSVHMKDNGRDFAVGLGDGSVQLFHFEGKKKFVADQTLKAHTLGVSQVHFPHFKNSPNLLLSGGNDAKLVLWDYHTNQNGFHASENTASSYTANTQGFGVRCTINHRSKINWISSFSTDKNQIYIGDLSNQITIYDIIG